MQLLPSKIVHYDKNISENRLMADSQTDQGTTSFTSPSLKYKRERTNTDSPGILTLHNSPTIDCILRFDPFEIEGSQYNQLSDPPSYHCDRKYQRGFYGF